MYHGEVKLQIGEQGFDFAQYKSGSIVNVANMVMEQEPLFTVKAVSRCVTFSIPRSEFVKVMYQCEDL